MTLLEEIKKRVTETSIHNEAIHNRFYLPDNSFASYKLGAIQMRDKLLPELELRDSALEDAIRNNNKLQVALDDANKRLKNNNRK